MMETSVIDTLRYASRLKAAGVESRQAEAMSRALGDEIGGGVATKVDLERVAEGFERGLEHAVAELKGEIGKVDARVDVLDAKFDAIDEKFVGVDGRFDAVDAKFDAVDAKFDAVDAKFDAMDAKFDAMDAKFDALAGKLDMQGRYVFLVLAVIVALGLFNAIYPQFAAKGPQTANVQTTAPATSPVSRSDAAATE